MTTHDPSTPARRIDAATGLVLLLGVLWGSSWPMFNVVLRELSVWTFRGLAVMGAGLLLLAIARLRGIPLGVPRASWPALLGASLGTISVWYVAATASVLFIPSGQASILGYTMPLWAALMTVLLFGERPTPRLLLALAFGAGTVVLLAIPNLRALADAPVGIGCALTAAIGWAAGTLIQKRADWRGTHPLTLTAWQMTLGSLPILMGAAVLADWRPFIPSWPVLLAAVHLALVPTALGTLVWFRIVHLLPANTAAVSTIIVPVIAMAGGAWAHGEPLGPWQLAALGCCVAALGLALLKPSARRG
ncbi:MAG: DMT family transporter [Reyranellaceae bacterium]